MATANSKEKTTIAPNVKAGEAASHQVAEKEASNQELLELFLEQQKLLIDKIEAKIEKSGDTKKKDWWDKCASLGGVLTFLSSIVIAVGGFYITYSYKQQDVQLAQAQAVEKYLPALNSPNSENKRGALLAIYSLGNNELAARLATSYVDSGNLDACETILSSASGTAKEQLINAMIDAYKTRADYNDYGTAKGVKDPIRDYNRIFELKKAELIKNDFGNWYLAVIYTGRGNVYREYHEFDKADADYQAAFQAHPDYFWTYMNIGMMYAYQKEFDKAIEYLNKSIKFNLSGETYVQLGLTYEKMDKFGEATAQFDKAIEIEPFAFNHYFKRAYFHLRRKELAKAESDFLQIYRLSNNESDRFQSLQELKRLDPKYDQIEKIIKNNPADTLPPIPEKLN